jgi:transcriptional regulator with XRE-family HTH domain
MPAKILSWQEQELILVKLRQGISQRKLAVEYGVSQSTIAGLVKDRRADAREKETVNANAVALRAIIADTEQFSLDVRLSAAIKLQNLVGAGMIEGKAKPVAPVNRCSVEECPGHGEDPFGHCLNKPVTVAVPEVRPKIVVPIPTNDGPPWTPERAFFKQPRVLGPAPGAKPEEVSKDPYPLRGFDRQSRWKDQNE